MSGGREEEGGVPGTLCRGCWLETLEGPWDFVEGPWGTGVGP